MLLATLDSSFLNCTLCQGGHSPKSKGNRHKKSAGSLDPSVNGSDPSSTGDCSIATKNQQNGSVKDNLFISGDSRLTSSHSRLDAKSISLANESINTSKFNLLPSDSCSVLMKQSVDRISTSEQSDICRRLETVVRRLERLLDTDDIRMHSLYNHLLL